MVHAATRGHGLATILLRRARRAFRRPLRSAPQRSAAYARLAGSRNRSTRSGIGTGMPQRSFFFGSSLQEALLVRDHFAAGVQIHERAEIPAGLLLELGAEDIARIARGARPCRASGDRRSTPCSSRAASPCPSRSSPVPPRRARTGASRKRRLRCAAAYSRGGNLPAEVRPGGIREPAPEMAGAVAESLWECFGSAVQENARALARTCAEHDGTGRDVLLLAGLAVDEVNAVGAALRIQGDFASHRIGQDVEIARLHRLRDQTRGRLERRADRAAASARRRVEACRAPCERLREDRHAAKGSPGCPACLPPRCSRSS